MFPHLFSYLSWFIIFFFFGSILLQAEDKERDQRQDIQNLVQKLGDDSFAEREKAQARLLRIGIDAFPELKKAILSDDVEIVRRAEYILGQFEMLFRDRENSLVRRIVDLYASESSIAQKATFIWLLGNPVSGFGYPDGEGFESLCRIARFDSEYALRAEAIKCLIAMPPIAPSKKVKWYRSLRTVFAEPGDDMLLKVVHDFANLRCEIDALREEMEIKVATSALEKGTELDYPVPLQPSETLLQQAEHFREQLNTFLADPNNSQIQPGNRVDMLLYHALAEMEESLGLERALEETLQAATSTKVEPIRSGDQLLPNDPLAGGPFNDNFYVAYVLFENNRYRWALRHFNIAIREAAPELRISACSVAANAAHLLGEMEETLRLLDQGLEHAASEEYRQQHSDAAEQKGKLEVRKLYYLALVDAEKKDWPAVMKRIEEILKRDPYEIDTIILRYQLCLHYTELGPEYHAKMKPLIEGAIEKVEKDIREDNLSLHTACNQVAWLLANTGGDYPTALTMINETIRNEPESAIYLDTQAHVFALGKEYVKAVRTQEEALRLAPEAFEFRKALKMFRKLATDH